MGEVVYTMGSMNAEKIIAGHEYYRFLTSIFLHADIEHLVSNMIFLFGLGQMVEQVVGHVSFGIVYLLSGFGGSISSVFMLSGQEKCIILSVRAAQFLAWSAHSLSLLLSAN